MLKFNNDNIFTGYIKQLLASFNLPKYRVYTKEQQEHHDKYWANANKYKQALKSYEEEVVVLTENINVWTTARESATPAEKEKLDILIADAKKDLEIAEQNLKEARRSFTPETGVIVTVYRNSIPQYDDLAENFISGAGRSETSYPLRMRYMPYIRNGIIQEYAPKVEDGEIVDYSPDDWKICHEDFGKSHRQVHKHPIETLRQKRYVYNIKELNYTKNLKIQNSIYDSYTHEYLGDYLRFQRDYNGINLMPLYNCFSNRVCPRLDLRFGVENGVVNGKTTTYSAEFVTTDKKYKIYMVPIKLFKTYTIAIDSNAAIEMCCGLYGQYQYKDEKYSALAKQTYMCFSNMQFRTPVLYDKTLDLDKFLTVNDTTELAQHEDDLKLFIKVPFNNESSIVILEGDYTRYNDTFVCEMIDKDAEFTKLLHSFYKKHPKFIYWCDYVQSFLLKPFTVALEDESISENQRTKIKNILAGDYPRTQLRYYNDVLGLTTIPPKEGEITYTKIDCIPDITIDEFNTTLNYAVTLFGNRWWKENGNIYGLNNELLDSISHIDELTDIKLRLTNNTAINFDCSKECLELLTTKLITPLQLLRTNTGISYPFADRLIEYIVGNAVVPTDEIADNIKRAKVIAERNTNSKVINIVDDSFWVPEMQLIYYTYINANHDVNDINHDILGYVDRDVEKLYAHTYYKDEIIKGKPVKTKIVDTISSVDIYDWWEDSQED